ncbi:MAG: demethoxyubiquinone hydroxylase family protein [Alphaproteobacteria bacterium]|nr:demethoxyubiquinone hydroxylase family protein [Alphaproteobacteria bacterium]
MTKAYYYLPGDQKHKDDLSALYRVDQAGELGAVQIYTGQLRGVQNPSAELTATLTEMKGHEEEHFTEFNRLIASNQTRPSLLHPLWRRLGFAIGFLTARSGIPSAMSLTVAVEDEINEHYLEQLKHLPSPTNISPSDHLPQKAETIADDSKTKAKKPSTAPSPTQSLADKIEQFRQEELLHRDTALEQGAKEMRFYKVFYPVVRGLSRLAINVAKKI